VVVNVAQLLKSDVGASRHYNFDEAIQPFGDSIRAVAPVLGEADFLRTTHGIVVRGHFSTAVDLECSRCLDVYVENVEIDFAEEFVPIVDVNTGAPLNIPRDADTFLINDKHELDLEPAIREYGLLALPMKPLCESACAGLCPRCGINRNTEKCTCILEEPDDRFAALRSLLNEDSIKN
jgi:uncharacterized protein